MPNCCYPDEYDEFFSEGGARRTVRSFLRRGLRGSARTLADGVIDTGIEDATVLEIGGGAGQIHVRLLQAGASSATNVELSGSWERAAEQLLAEVGLSDRVDRRRGDVVDQVDELPPADVVVLHRVICCYPDWPAMVGSAIALGRRVIAVSIPVDRWWTRLFIRAGNTVLRWRGRSFRAFVHPPHAIAGILEAAGFRRTTDTSGPLWRTMVLVREPQPA